MTHGMAQKPILLMDSNPTERQRLGHHLSHYATDLPPVVAVSLEVDARVTIERHNPCCCVLDCTAPDQNSLAILHGIRSHHSAEALPVIVLTAEGDEPMVLQMLQNGAQDYVVKRAADGARLYGAVRSVLQTASLQKQLMRLAHYDALTGLLNRSLLINRLGQAIHRCNRYGQRCAVMHLDIHKFKLLNDVFGQECGDAVLQQVAERIRSSCRATDSPARLGADEFAILLENIETDMCTRIAKKLVDAIEQPIDIQGHSHPIVIAIGISVYPDTASNADDLLKQADEALQRAKRSHSLKYVSFSEKYKREWTRQQVLERDLAGAISHGDLALVYQPIVDGQHFGIKRLEALTRWPRSDYQVHAIELIDMIDRLGLADAFHDWLFDTAFCQVKALESLPVPVDLCVNIPANYCYSKHIEKALLTALSRHHINPTTIELEITESTLMLYPERSVQLLTDLHTQGLRIAVDDFGTGYSSMAYLTRLPLDTLKIDKHFFLDNVRDQRNKKVIAAVTALGHSLGLEIVAEGIETQAELALAQQVGCDLLQGFYFGKPTPVTKGWADYFAGYPLIVSPVKK